jgi:predicted RNA-binding Zn-ribbon protein involved in translation (DUF1610 family)
MLGDFLMPLSALGLTARQFWLKVMSNPSTTVMDWFKDRTAIVATMHQKEQAIAPILEPALALQIRVPDAFDTDRFGTFTREVKRPGDQLETARLKALKALEISGADLAIASEGSFAPHPGFPMLPCNRELVILIDAVHNLEVIGEIVSTKTNFNHRNVRNFVEANEFAATVGFPDHGLIVRVDRDSDEMVKGIREVGQLRDAVEFALARSSNGTIFLETDMRAMHNPTRMTTIAQATQDLLEKLQHQCPSCGTPGFRLLDRQSGLPCGWCSSPTDQILAHLYECKKCGFQQKKLYPEGVETSDPMYCHYCNP